MCPAPASSTMTCRAQPLVKWAGGKRQLLGQLVPRMPVAYGTYYEPFFGGGALAFAVSPGRLILNDLNESLVGLYELTRDDPDALASGLDWIQAEYNALPDMDAKLAYYMSRRSEYNGILSGPWPDSWDVRLEAAVLLVFLNKAGYNGMYRTNAKGLFNVPFGKRENLSLYDRDNLLAVSGVLQGADILCGDFEQAVGSAASGDFVFFDSPYHGTFDTYQSGGFSESDHRRLAALFAGLDARGAYCMLTNSDTPFIRDLYAKYRIESVPVRRSVSCKGNSRSGTELIIRNF